jgi:predicted MPP superfamily phosphohydrolase
MSGILFQFVRIFKLPVSKINLARILVSLAFALFIIGVISTFFFKVTSVELHIDNLPEAWKNKKIVLISDLHLGSIHGLSFLEKVASQVNALNPDYLIITGDLFDGADGGVPEIGPRLNLLQAKSKVIFIPGNHDKYLGLDKINNYLSKTNVLTLRDEAVNIEGLEIIGYDYLNKEWEDTRQIKNLSDYHGQARLLLNHIPTEIEKAKDLHVSLQLSGHSHRGQMWPVSILTRLIYGSYHYGLTTEGSYNIYTTSGVGSWGPPLRTFNRPEIVQIILK